MSNWTFFIHCESGNIAEILNMGLNELEVMEPSDRQEGFDIACACGHEEIVKHLAERFGNLSFDDGMRLATKNAKTNVVKLLLVLSAKRNPNW